MPRQRLAIGTFGEISIRALPSGRVEARTRYRDWDGQNRQVRIVGSTARAAERALKTKLAARDSLRPAETSLTPDSLFSDLVTYWLNDIDLEGRISRTTRNLYERDMRTLVTPVFGNLTLREIGVARCDQFIKQLAKISYSRANGQSSALRRPRTRARPSTLRATTERTTSFCLDGQWAPLSRYSSPTISRFAVQSQVSCWSHQSSIGCRLSKPIVLGPVFLRGPGTLQCRGSRDGFCLALLDCNTQ